MFIMKQHCVFWKVGAGFLLIVSNWPILGTDKNKLLCIMYILFVIIYTLLDWFYIRSVLVNLVGMIECETENHRIKKEAFCILSNSSAGFTDFFEQLRTSFRDVSLETNISNMTVNNHNGIATWVSVAGITWQRLYFPLTGRPFDVTAISRQSPTVNTLSAITCKIMHSNQREQTKLCSIISFSYNSKSI